MAKIAILHEVLGRSKGGIEAWIYHASEELILQGHEVTLFHTMVSVPEDAAPTGAKIVNIPSSLISPSIFFLRLMHNSKRFLKGKIDSFDAVWARSFCMAWCAGQLIPFEKALYVNAAPYAYYARQPFFKQLKRVIKGSDIKFSNFLSSQLSYIVAYYSEKTAIRKCINVYLSRERKKQTLKFFNLKDSSNKYLVVPAGVDIKRFVPATSRWDGNTTLKLITVCRLTEGKNIQCVLNAISLLQKLDIDVHLTIVGEGKYFNELNRMVERLDIRTKVSFVGMKKNVEEWYRESHLFVLPSLYEGFGSVYVEAMASGLPCIAISNRSGKYSVAADEIIDHRENGFLMNNNSAEELSQYILELFNSSDELARLGENARRKVVDFFSWEKTIENLLRISIK